MNNGDLIQKVLNEAPHRDAAWFTNILKAIGKGDMRRSSSVIADYFYRMGNQKGRIEGAVIGAAGTLVLVCVSNIIKDMIKNREILEADGERMLRDIQEEINKNKAE